MSIQWVTDTLKFEVGSRVRCRANGATGKVVGIRKIWASYVYKVDFDAGYTEEYISLGLEAQS